MVGALSLPLPGFVLGAARLQPLPRLHLRSPPETLLPLPVHKLLAWCAELVGKSCSRQSAEAPWVVRGVISRDQRQQGANQKGLSLQRVQPLCGTRQMLGSCGSALALFQGRVPRG